MFFIAGVFPKRDELEYNQNIICPVCSKYGRYNVFVEYMVFSLFFIPIIKFNKKYYVSTSCCGSLYSIDKDIGRKIARNEDISIREEDLQPIRKAHIYSVKKCTKCGFETREDFLYCPKCGSKL